MSELINELLLYMRQYKDKKSNRKIFKSMYLIEY